MQLKSRLTVNFSKYGGFRIWLLFPDPNGKIPGREWYLIEHDELFVYMKKRHGTAACWDDAWSSPNISVEQRQYLEPFVLRPR